MVRTTTSGKGLRLYIVMDDYRKNKFQMDLWHFMEGQKFEYYRA